MSNIRLYNLLKNKINKSEGIISIEESGANKDDEICIYCKGISMPDIIRDLIYEKQIEIVDCRIEDKNLMKLWVSLFKSDLHQIEKIIAPVIAVSWYVPQKGGSVGINFKTFTNKTKAQKFLKENGFPDSALSEFELTWDFDEYEWKKGNLKIK